MIFKVKNLSAVHLLLLLTIVLSTLGIWWGLPSYIGREIFDRRASLFAGLITSLTATLAVCTKDQAFAFYVAALFLLVWADWRDRRINPGMLWLAAFPGLCGRPALVASRQSFHHDADQRDQPGDPYL